MTNNECLNFYEEERRALNQVKELGLDLRYGTSNPKNELGELERNTCSEVYKIPALDTISDAPRFASFKKVMKELLDEHCTHYFRKMFIEEEYSFHQIYFGFRETRECSLPVENLNKLADEKRDSILYLSDEQLMKAFKEESKCKRERNELIRQEIKQEIERRLF